MTLKFIQRSEFHLESTCRHYTIDKILMTRGYRYGAYFRPDIRPRSKRDENKPMAEDLGCFDSADKAKAMCESHLKTRPKPTVETTT